MVSINYEVKHVRRNEFSRPGYKLLRLQAVVLHYTANPGAGADDHFRYFDQSIISSKRYAGCHIVIDRHKAIELVPLDEGTFGANDGGTVALKLPTLRARDARYPTSTGDGNANLLTVHIEMCQEPNGQIHEDTIKRTALVLQQIQSKYPQLKDTRNRIVRHFDVTGKNCPKPMVDDPKEFTRLLDMVDGKISIEPPKQSQPKQVSSSGKLYKVQVFAGSKDGADRMADKLKKDGYPVYIVQE
ncbi:putative N-acetylmuramoyl-L-alanine amidase [Bacillus phage vB_BhaS-171]|uniref:endolysin n=1 Tax=Bacillus phage vB_BhaS-171 TaxID=1775140 RepID=UPI000744B650|nr:endolysin [Bacillus phage vB_BhaS-171]ALY08085.1 putative N-acetylmuramoyl-L-alanine amidase [Bacillus phage vB_BhaS-171]